MPLTIDWYPDYWVKEEKEELFNFWRERYFNNAVYLSPSKDVCGGVGLFDAFLFSLHHKSERNVSDELHPVNKSFKLRQESLIKQKTISQEADRKRLQLLMIAEKSGLEWWQNKIIYQLTGKEPDYLEEIYNAYVESFELIYKDSLAQLIEYDREYGNPLSDPNRNLEKQPISLLEYRRWLSRKGRLLLESTPDDIYIKKEWKKVTHSEVQHIIPLGTSFVPDYLLQSQARRMSSDVNKGLLRNKSGCLVSDINNKKKSRPTMPLILSRIGDLADRIYNFKNIQDDARPDIEKVEIELDIINEDKYSLSNPPPLPEGNPYLFNNGELFAGIQSDDEYSVEEESNSTEYSEETIEEDPNQVLNILHVSNEIRAMVDRIEKENKTEEEECILQEEDSENAINELFEMSNSEELREPDVEEKEIVVPYKLEIPAVIVIDKTEDDEEDSNTGKAAGKAGGEEPEWMKNRNFDGSNTKSLGEFDPSQMFKPGQFERDQKLNEIVSQWKFVDKNKEKQDKEQTEEQDFWNSATQKVTDFKGKAVSLWKRKIAPTLGLETAERRAISKIKNQELRHLQKMIQKMDNKLSITNEEKVKPKTYKPKM